MRLALVTLALALTAVLARPQPATCQGICTGVTCFSSAQCAPGCVCARPDLGQPGSCVTGG